MLSRSRPAGRTRTARGPARASRPGLTLLEVIVSTAIFLMALVAIARLTILANTLARDAQFQTEALQLAQAKLAEVVSGVTPLQGQSNTAFDPSQVPSGQDGWTWSMDCTAGSVTNTSGQTMVWTVRITVQRPRPDGSSAQVTLTQMVLDPSVRGSTLNSNSGSSGSGSSGGSGGSSTSP